MAKRQHRKSDVETLVEISRAVGSDDTLIQAGGGNTSVKSADGSIMHVKASGTSLARMSRTRGYVTLRMPGTLALLKDTRLMQMPAARREKKVLDRLMALRVGGQPDGRPSVEASLHAILGRCVVHTHPWAVNALACAKNSRRAVALLRPACPEEPLYVPYTDPGHPLAVKLSRLIDGYRREHGKIPTVIVLENHGLFVSCRSAARALRITIRIVKLCRSILKRKRRPPAKTRKKPVNEQALAEVLL
ncbi:MAG: class II aldolase/adducin family protein, partial [Planctomycetia bacterium]|nr:class II aldolase/adducin family protein [Planctomycetia bacterium]